MFESVPHRPHMQRAPSAKTEQEIFTDYIDEINPPKNFDGNSPVGTSDRMCAGYDRQPSPCAASVEQVCLNYWLPRWISDFTILWAEVGPPSIRCLAGGMVGASEVRSNQIASCQEILFAQSGSNGARFLSTRSRASPACAFGPRPRPSADLAPTIADATMVMLCWRSQVQKDVAELCKSNCRDVEEHASQQVGRLAP